MRMKIPPQPIKALHGDERWTLISPLSSYAPIIVLSLLVMSIIQIALGAVWISKLAGSLSFPLVLQPLVLPCLSLFNTIPSAHLHLYSRFNNPSLSTWFCGILFVCYAASFLVSVIVCAPSPPIIRTECPLSRSGGTSGPDISESYWGANVALWLISAVGYGILTVMAAIVWRGFRRLEKGDAELPMPRGQGGATVQEGEGTELENRDAAPTTNITTRQFRTRGIGEGKHVRDWQEEMLTDEQRAQRLKKAEEKWKKVSGL